MHKFKMYSPCCTWYLEIETDCDKVAALINTLFCGFIVSDRPSGDALEILNVTIEKHGEGYVMIGKGRKYPIKNLNDVGFYLYAVIDKLVEGNVDKQYCVFHGGVVAKGDQVYGIIAPTMTGKSTLVTYLSLNGFEYLADDYIFVKRDTRVITPLPLPGSLRNKNILCEALKHSYTVDGHNELKGENNVLVSLYGAVSREYYLDKVFFIRRSDENIMNSMEKGLLYKEMLFNLKSALDLDKERNTIKQFVECIEGYELAYRDFDFVLSIFKSFE